MSDTIYQCYLAAMAALDLDPLPRHCLWEEIQEFTSGSHDPLCIDQIDYLISRQRELSADPLQGCNDQSMMSQDPPY